MFVLAVVLAIFSLIAICFMIIEKSILVFLRFVLITFLGLNIKIKSISILNLNAKDIFLNLGPVQVAARKLELRRKTSENDYIKQICMIVTDLKVSIAPENSKNHLKFNKSPEEAVNHEIAYNMGIYFNPFIMKVFELLEIRVENCTFTTLNEDQSIKLERSYPKITLIMDKYEKRYQKVSSKKDLFLVVKNKDDKWKHFPETYFPPEFNFFVDQYKNFEIREDDIILSGFPRSGTTRAQEMIWLMVNDFNFSDALKYDSDIRCPLLDHPIWSFVFRKNEIAASLSEMASPRVIKTHLPVQLLPDQVWTKKPKIIYISREVKDVAVSNYHFWSTMSINLNMTPNDYFDRFLNGTVVYGPYRESLQNYFNLPDYKNILYITYEEMSTDLDGTILKVAEFLGQKISTKNLKLMKEHLKFDKMKGNLATNNKKFVTHLKKCLNVKGEGNDFIRKGIIGDHKNVMTQEYIDRFDRWYADSESLNQGFNYI